ncbi:hypothetical protein GF327_05610 [Candidatus Woesearchaeota archaeon]|nr:hypothetical protein [Candidatus Woesearchaeota archaeon]
MAVENVSMYGTTNFGYTIVVVLFSVLINSFLLEFLSKHFKLKKNHYKQAFLVSVFTALLNVFLEIIIKENFYFLIYPISFTVSSFIIKYVYILKEKKALVFTSVWFAAGIVLEILTYFVIAGFNL